MRTKSPTTTPATPTKRTRAGACDQANFHLSVPSVGRREIGSYRTQRASGTLGAVVNSRLRRMKTKTEDSRFAKLCCNAERARIVTACPCCRATECKWKGFSRLDATWVVARWRPQPTTDVEYDRATSRPRDSGHETRPSVCAVYGVRQNEECDILGACLLNCQRRDAAWGVATELIRSARRVQNDCQTRLEQEPEVRIR